MALAGKSPPRGSHKASKEQVGSRFKPQLVYISSNSLPPGITRNLANVPTTEYARILRSRLLGLNTQETIVQYGQNENVSMVKSQLEAMWKKAIILDKALEENTRSMVAYRQRIAKARETVRASLRDSERVLNIKILK